LEWEEQILRGFNDIKNTIFNKRGSDFSWLQDFMTDVSEKLIETLNIANISQFAIKLHLENSLP